MPPRATKEWIGRHPDQAVPPRVKLRIWRRQCGDNNFAICPLSALPIRDTDEKHLDHEKALIEGGEHREFNLRYVHAAPHREKTRDEVERRAKNDARAKRAVGIKGARSQLAGRDRATIDADREATSNARKTTGKLPVPARTRDIFGRAL